MRMAKKENPLRTAVVAGLGIGALIGGVTGLALAAYWLWQASTPGVVLVLFVPLVLIATAVGGLLGALAGFIVKVTRDNSGGPPVPG